MKPKLLNISLILTSFIGYLEWGTDMHMFLIEGEIDVLIKAFTSFSDIIHPFILLPLFGQVVLIFTLFQKQPSKKITYLGMICIAILLVFVFLIGVISFNYKILLSAIPYLFVMLLVFKYYKKQKLIS
jgi:predicted neutral ceramidase superfamily lipid hydrolase